MLLHLKRLSKQTLIFGLGDAVSRIAALLLLPLYTRVLSTDDYGKLAIVTLISTVLVLVLELGQRTAYFRFYFKFEDASVRRRLTGTLLIFLLVETAGILVPLILAFDRLGWWLVRDITLLPLIKISLLGVFFDIGSLIPFVIFRAEQRAWRYATLSLARFLCNLVLNIVAVVILRWGVLGIIYANLATSGLFFVISLWLTIRVVAWTFEFSLLKQLLRFGLPLVPLNLAAWALNLSDRFFVQRYQGLSQVGVYAIAYSIVGALNMITNWFNTAYAPYLFSISNLPDARIVMARTFTYAMTFFTAIGLCLSLFAREILVILARPSYFGAAKVVPILVVGYLSFELFYLFSFGLDITEKTSYYPPMVIAGAIVNLALNIGLIPRFGMMGAAIATALSYAFLPFIEYLIVRRFYPVPYEWVRLLKLLAVSVAACLAGTILKRGHLWTDLIISSLLVLAWLLALYQWKFFTANEISSIHTASNAALNSFRRHLGYTGSKIG